MSSYATVEQVRTLAGDLSVKIPADDAQLLRLIERASGDVERIIGARDLDPLLLLPAQASALAAATSWQTILLAVHGAKRELGADDLIASVPLVSFRPPGSAPRVSPRAVEILSRTGLIQRSKTVPPPPIVLP